MAPLAPPDKNNISSLLHQSRPVDVSAPYSPSTLRGKTILLTGGASGLGAAFARAWAAHGAHLIIADVNDEAGTSLAAELRSSSTTGGGHHHFVHVDVASWASQAALFREAARLSPTGELDAVVASAGISDRHGAITGRGFENPAGLDAPDAPPPDLRCVEVNLVGMLYTAHLALFWLRRDNPAPSPAQRAAMETRRDTTKAGAGAGAGDGEGEGGGGGGGGRDRHFLMVGSSAGLAFLPGVPEYVTSKHGVTGLFRSLRTLSYRQGVRVNMLCPYFVDTPILPNRAVAMVAGLGLGRLDDTVDAATRFMAATPRIAGRALVVGPRVSLLRRVLPDHEVVDGEEEEEEVEEPSGGGGDVDVDVDVVVDGDVALGRGQGVWECYAHDYETVDFFIRRYVRVLNTIAAIKGWAGFFRELYHALFVREEPKPARARV